MAVLVAVTLLTAACTGSSSVTPRATPTPVASSPSAQAGTLSGLVNARAVLTLPLENYRSVTHAALVGHFLVFGACESCQEGDPPDELVAADLRTGALQRIARSHFARGQTDWVEGTGNYAVYTDQSRVQDDANAATVWTLNATNLATHATFQLASSQGRPDNGLPSPRAGDGYAIWASVSSSGNATLEVEPLRPGATPQVVATGGQYRDFGVAQGRAVFVDATGHLMIAALGPGQPKPISYEAHVGSVRVGADGNMIWPKPANGDPSSLWTSQLAAANTSRRVYSGDNQMQVVGADFAAFFRLGGPAGDVLSVVPLRGGRAVTVSRNPYVPSRLVARGHLLAYATSQHLFKPTQVITLHVIRVGSDSQTP